MSSHGAADLVAELVCYLLLILSALFQQGPKGVSFPHAEEAPDVQKRMEGPQGYRLLLPETGVPRGIAGRLTPRCKDEHPLLTVGHQAKWYVRGMQQFRHAGGRGCLPVPSNKR